MKMSMFETIEYCPLISSSLKSPYLETAKNLVSKLLPASIRVNPDLTEEEFVGALEKELPLVKRSDFLEPPFHLSIYLLCPHRVNATKFFYDMIHRWLIPGRKINVALFFATDFQFVCSPKQDFIVAEMAVKIGSDEELYSVRRNFDLIAREISLGVSSVYQASRILEMKGLSIDQKTALIQERLTTVLDHLPRHFDTDLFVHMQRFLVTTSEVYKGMRDYLHLTRMITLFYLMQKKTKKAVDEAPSQRYVRVKVVPLKLQMPLGLKRVFGLFVTFNFLKEHEIFQKRHLKRALQQFDPTLSVITDSFITFEKHEDKILSLYLEVEKESTLPLSIKERFDLTHRFPEFIKANIESLLRPLFKPRNEEEVMRNIVILSGQLHFVRDMPQVIISFDEQGDEQLVFTITLVRLMKNGVRAADELFKNHEIFRLERVKKVGKLRKKTVKEALVLRASIDSAPFLREDLSFDLYRARYFVLNELQTIVGEVRDYNGGMISKQNELFLALKESLDSVGKNHTLLLENFFYAIFPIELRALMQIEPLKKLFLMLLETLGEGEKTLEQEDDYHYFILLSTSNEDRVEEILLRIEDLGLGRLQLAKLHFQYFDSIYLGFILFSKDPEKVNSLKFSVF